MNQHLLAILFTGISLAAFAQAPIIQWQRSLGGSGHDWGWDIALTDDGGYILAGATQSNDGDVEGQVSGWYSIWIVKLTATGAIEWQKIMGGSGTDWATSIQQTTDGGYIVGGYSNSNDGDVSGTHGDYDFWVVKLSNSGDIQWQKSLGGSGEDQANSIRQTNDGGYIVAGYSNSNDGDVSGNRGGQDFWVVKLSAGGDIEWQKSLGGPNNDVANSVQQTTDGGYIVAGIGLGAQFLIIKLAENGDVQWQESLGGSGLDRAHSIVQTTDGGYFVVGETTSTEPPFFANYGLQDFWVVKLTHEGDVQWVKSLGGSGADFALSGHQTTDGGYIVVGTSTSNDVQVFGNHGSFDYWLVKLSATGNIEWQKCLGGSDFDEPKAVRQTPDGGYIIAGYSQSNNGDVSGNHGNYDIWVVKLFSPASAVAGRIHFDLEQDCLPDEDEAPLSGSLITAQHTTNIFSTFYAVTDSAGNYFIPLDSGSYTLTITPPNSFWENCNSPAQITVANDTAALNFPLNATILCPYLTVDIATPFLRRCFDNTYTVHYCNYGSITAENAYVEISLDPHLEYISSTLPLSGQNGNLLTFDLGDVGINECGYFHLTVHLDCDSTVLGQTHCVEAHIFPDSICIPPNSLWDGSSIEVEGKCEGDSALFILLNIGPGDMSQERQFIIIEDDIVLMQGDFQLDAAQSQEVRIPANGATLRLEAQQSPGHPSGQASVGATVEGCNGPLTPGLFIQWPANHPNPFVDTHCRQNIGSFDPNDKTALPAGFGLQRLIEPGQDIEYMIRFQNTGTDTAFKVVIVDVLPPELNLGTLRPGAASHPYTYSVTPEGRPVFTFDNILLPDSTTNEAASQGFVNFSISQQPALPLTTLIANKALIYFDFNEPIETNYAQHRIGIVFPWAPPGTVSTRPVPSQAMQVRVIPNPLDDRALLQVEGIAPGRLRLVLTNTFGQILHTEETLGTGFEFRRGALPAGLYFFKIERAGRLVGTGKIILR
jgi:uncharacterized repeat protein (TIGR01451 family)